jgi:wobble nucleotide-excising tRNase
MRVGKISKLNTATYSNYTWPADLASFADINIFLGWNGSGKTVVSRVFKHLESNGKDFSDDTDTFSVEVDGKNVNKVSGEQFPKGIRVFNEAYIKSITEPGFLPHIFYLGDVQVDYSEKEQELETLKKNRKVCTDDSLTLARTAIQLIQGVDGILGIKKEIETDTPYRSYTIDSFKKRVKKITDTITTHEEKNIESFILSEDKLSEHKEHLKNLSVQEVAFNTLKKENDWLNKNHSRIQGLLDSIPTQQTSVRIDAFEKESKELRWIQQGVHIHFENENSDNRDVCIFCNNEITNQDELQKHFSKDFMYLTNELDTIEGYVESAINRIKNLVGYAEIKSTVQVAFTDIQSKIIEKRKGFSEKQTLAEFSSCFEDDEVYSSNDVSASAWKIETHYVASVYEDYIVKEKAYKECVDEQANNKKRIGEVEIEIGELKAKEANIHVPAEKLSRLLNTAFPYKKIEIKNSKNGIGYELYRKDEPCDFISLSEGERNFIALAYFLVSINNKKGDDIFDDDGIVVIDDPVSSLDKGTIFQIFPILLLEIQTNKNRQYFLLTHNLDFYGHLLQAIYKKAGDDNEASKCNLYQIAYDQNGSKIVEMDKFLRDFKSDYLYSVNQLWKKKGHCEMSDAVLIANLMRRCWETFLRFKFANPGSFGVMLEQGYQTACTEHLSSMNGDVPEDRKQQIRDDFEESKLAMYRFLNYGSHEYTDVDTSDEAILQGVNERLDNFFEIVKLLDKHHYKKVTTTK